MCPFLSRRVTQWVIQNSAQFLSAPAYDHACDRPCKPICGVTSYRDYLPAAILFVCHSRRGRGHEFLEARIIPERIEHRIEPEQRWGERHVLSQRAIVRYREQFL